MQSKNDFFEQLSDLTKNILKTKNKVIITLTGKAGTGKSTVGKYFRKNGFGDFSRYSISVIDDGVMSLDLFYIFNKRVKFKTTTKDELEPFLRLLPKRKKIIFYINQEPELRLSKSNIVIYLTLDEKNRQERLEKRDGKFKKQSDTKIKIDYDHLIKVDMRDYEKEVYLK